jgi:hypothetical protein
MFDDIHTWDAETLKATYDDAVWLLGKSRDFASCPSAKRWAEEERNACRKEILRRQREGVK